MKETELPLISVIVPVYGTEKYFDRCIQSLLDQSFRNLEIIVVNDGSPGNIRELAENYRGDPRVRLVNLKKNRGLLYARLSGVRAAAGQFLAFVDSDDYISQDYYRVMLQKALETDADIVIGKTVWEEDGQQFVYSYHDSTFSFGALQGDEIRQAFFGQEFQCYSWHTIWNKLYHRELWEHCRAEFETVTEHIVMTEDIYLSSVLFYKARKVVPVHTEAYFYCRNKNAATDSLRITVGKFEKDICDMQFAFSRTEYFLKKEGAGQSDMDGLHRGKMHYARMWENLARSAFTGETRRQMELLVRRFCPDSTDGEADSCDDGCADETAGSREDYYFESARTPWKGGLEYIKQKIRKFRGRYISFDIFDTLICRPFYEPSDLFRLLNREFSSLTGNDICFDALRISGERQAREYYHTKEGFEDVTLREIYGFICGHYGIDPAAADHMRRLEEELEIKFCRPRFSGRELLDYAKSTGREVILISDMYLEEETVEKMLWKNGIEGFQKLYLSSRYRKVKGTGGLFRAAMRDLKVTGRKVLHIGDDWHSDMEGSRAAGIEAVFFPKAREVFENKIQGCPTNRCSRMAAAVCRSKSADALMENLGYRCMLALAANRYFDNPYRTFCPDSDFNLDPYLIGYYVLGMHMLGLSKWLSDIMEDGKYQHLIFLSRDGYLPMKAFQEYQRYFRCNEEADVRYMRSSRRALMPLMVKDRLNFYQLPVSAGAHTPMTLLSVLSFAVDPEKTEKREIREWLKEENIQPDQAFRSRGEMDHFTDFFLRKLYDPQRHRRAAKLVRKYYSEIPENSLTFDMGYSGRIQGAICEACGRRTDAAFLHEDGSHSIQEKGYYHFGIRNFYRSRPAVTGPVREHVFSDLSGSCTGFFLENGKVRPVLERPCPDYAARFVIEQMHGGALDMVRDFCSIFCEYKDSLEFSPEEVSLPWEGFLRYPSERDLQLFSASFFEDRVFGAREKINIKEFAEKQLKMLGWPENTGDKCKAEGEKWLPADVRAIPERFLCSSRWKRGVIWLLLDRPVFMEKLKAALAKAGRGYEKNDRE